MAKKRTTRAGRRASREPKPAVRGLTYKVVELSVVDEGTLEHAVNEWVSRGWALEGVQFAMRESSKRPSMAFVFFTRDGPPLVRAQGEATEVEGPPRERIAAGVLREELNPVTTSVRDAWARLRELATEGEDEA